MATYRALRNVSGKTAFNGVYPFTIKQGEVVEADKAGGSWLNIKLPGAAPTPQQYAPIAKLPGNNFELMGSAVPATTQTNAPAAQVNLAKEGSKFFSNLWIPVVGANLGMFAGTYYAWHKGSGTWGFIGWSALGSLAGVLLAAPIVVVRVKSQAQGIGNKLDKIAANSSNATATNQQTSTATMKAAIVAENVKDGLDQKATEDYVNGLTEKELQSMYIMVKMPSDKAALAKRFPDLYKTTPQNENDAYKIMGAVAERLQGEFGISGLTASEFVTSLQSAMAKMFK
jgi:hypothetical protein